MPTNGLQIATVFLFALAVVIVAAMRRQSPGGRRLRIVGGILGGLILAGAASHHYPAGNSPTDQFMSVLGLLGVFVAMIAYATRNLDLG
jgi:drug/metabolite transporter (DMT)-like permease